MMNGVRCMSFPLCLCSPRLDAGRQLVGIFLMADFAGGSIRDRERERERERDVAYPPPECLLLA